MKEFDFFSLLTEVGLIFLVYFLIRKINPLWAKITFLFMAINPWLVVFSSSFLSGNWPNINLVNPENILKNYFWLLSGNFLFSKGIWPISYKALNYQGILFWSDLPLIVLGLYQLISRPKGKFETFLPYLLLISPLPAVLTGNLTLFSLFMLIPLIIISARGAICLMNKPKILVLISLFYVFFFVRFLDLYLLHR